MKWKGVVLKHGIKQMHCRMLPLWDAKRKPRQWLNQMTCPSQTPLCMLHFAHCGQVSLCECHAVSLKEDCLKDVAKRGQKEECLRKTVDMGDTLTCVIFFFLHCNVYRTVCSHLRMFISRRKKNAIYLFFLVYDLSAFKFFFSLKCTCVRVRALKGRSLPSFNWLEYV